MRRPTGAQIAVLEQEGYAIRRLAWRGISTRVDHYPRLKRFDGQAVAGAGRACHAIATAANHSIIRGLGSPVAGALGASISRTSSCRRREIPDLLAKHQTRVEDVARAAEEMLRTETEP